MTTAELMIGIEIYMPPVRRHWSRVLGRPMLSPIQLTADGYDDLGEVFLEELYGKECIVSFDSYCGPGQHVHISRLPGFSKSTVWHVRLEDENAGDANFARRWHTIYGHPWPMTKAGVHPALVDAYKRWLEFKDQWQRHNWNRESLFIASEGAVMDL
jgi:hypothetical protein